MNNIRKYRLQHGMKQVELCKSLGITQGALSGWENGHYEPDISSLHKLAEIFSTTVDDILGRTTSVQAKNVLRIPVYGQVAAGIPIEAITDIEDYEELNLDTYRDGEYIALRIHGHSMEPRMMEGDVVIVRLQDDVDSGDTAIVMANGDEATCKKIKKTPEGVFLMSTNPSYEPMFYSNKEIMNLPVRVLGKVVELRVKY